MNVIVSNKYQPMLQNLGIDIIKEMNGEFDVDEIISTFDNFFYQRMILDITAIKNYKNISNLQKLSISLDMNKVILLLDGTADTTNPLFISKLISMGIYNFARNIEEIQYLYNSPNSYRDVAQYHRLDLEQQPQPVSQPQVQQTNQPQTVVQTVYVDRYQDSYGCRVIGIKNATKHAGATTLVYMMTKRLQGKYSAIGIEVDGSDFTYFRDKNLVSVSNDRIATEVNKYKSKDVIFIDVNKSAAAEGLCSEIIYLLEPSILKLNKMIALNPNILTTLKNKKVILNKSLLSNKDVSDLSAEARLKFIYNMPPINDRNLNNEYLDSLLATLGFVK